MRREKVDGKRVYTNSQLPLFSRVVVLQRLNECTQLNEEYQKQFQRTKEKLKANPNEKQFEFR